MNLEKLFKSQKENKTKPKKQNKVTKQDIGTLWIIQVTWPVFSRNSRKRRERERRERKMF